MATSRVTQYPSAGASTSCWKPQKHYGKTVQQRPVGGRALYAMPSQQRKKQRSTAAMASRRLSISPSPPSGIVKDDAQKLKKKTRKIVAEEFQLEMSMMNHDLLTKAEEKELAELLKRSRQLQEQIDVLIANKKVEAQLLNGRKDLEDLLVQQRRQGASADSFFETDEDNDEDEYSHLSVYTSSGNSREYDAVIAEYGWHPSAVASKSALLQLHDQQSRTTQATLWNSDIGTADLRKDGSKNNRGVLGEDGYEFASACSDDALLLQDAFGLTEDDVVRDLQLPGGRAEMQNVLLEGARARDILIRSNLKLVSSITKRWSRMSSGRDTESLYALYRGGWDRPSVSEAVQEGVIGLTMAVERFDPALGLRFSTYATYWITNSVRQCFQRASTGCLRLPVNYYDTKTRLKSLVKEYYEVDGHVPEFAVLAERLGMTERRLQFMLRVTRPLLSTDGPLMRMGATKAGKAGNVNRFEDYRMLSDTLVDDTELVLEDRVELSLLRQSLEHAMAAELAPFERDILRMRLGLDDGVTRTCREVAEECGGRLSASEIRSTEQRALKKLRSPVALATHKLLTYLDFANVDIETVKLR